jgi:hypothetical protein
MDFCCGVRTLIKPRYSATLRAPLAARDLLAPEDKTPQGIILDFVILPTAGQQCPLPLFGDKGQPCPSEVQGFLKKFCNLSATKHDYLNQSFF